MSERVRARHARRKYDWDRGRLARSALKALCSGRCQPRLREPVGSLGPEPVFVLSAPQRGTGLNALRLTPAQRIVDYFRSRRHVLRACARTPRSTKMGREEGPKARNQALRPES